MTVSTPRHVIRFYSDSKYALEAIGFKEITYLHPDKLNDPFDPPFYFITDFDNDYQTLQNYVRQYHSEDFQRFNNHLPKESWEKYQSDIEKAFSMYRNNSFIFSTCGIDNEEHPKDSLYMWSHYGCGHRGVAIEFDTNLLIRAVSKSLGKPDDDPLFHICYENELPKITCEAIFNTIMSMSDTRESSETWDKTELYEIIERTLSLKSAVWKKEKEWRFIMSNEETKLKILKLGIEDDTITALYLGVRLDDHMKDDLFFETKHNFPNAKIYKSKIVQGKFALEFEPLN